MHITLQNISCQLFSFCNLAFTLHLTPLKREDIFGITPKTSFLADDFKARSSYVHRICYYCKQGITNNKAVGVNDYVNSCRMVTMVLKSFYG